MQGLHVISRCWEYSVSFSFVSLLWHFLCFKVCVHVCMNASVCPCSHFCTWEGQSSVLGFFIQVLSALFYWHRISQLGLVGQLESPGQKRVFQEKRLNVPVSGHVPNYPPPSGSCDQSTVWENSTPRTVRIPIHVPFCQESRVMSESELGERDASVALSEVGSANAVCFLPLLEIPRLLIHLGNLYSKSFCSKQWSRFNAQDSK